MEVFANGRPLRHIVRHSPTGLEWGYGGSGPSDLALSILADYLGTREAAEPVYMEFKWAFVAQFPSEGWRLTGEQIEAWLADAAPEVQGKRRRRPVVYEGRRRAAFGQGG